MPAICQLAGLKGQTPIIIDWSDLGRKRNGLFAAVCYRKRGLPLLSWATTVDELTPSQNRLEEAFIARLLRNLPDAIRPLLLADRGFGRASLLRRLQEMPRHTGRTVDYAVRLKGNVHIQTADGYQGLLRNYSLPSGRYVFLPGVRYRSDGAVTVNLVLYWGRGHREPWYLATSLPDAKVAVGQYRKRMQPEQYFRDGKQYFALDRGTATTTARLGRMLVGLLLACCLLLLAGRRASWQFRRRVCSWGKLGLLRLGMECYLATPEPPPRWFGLPHHMKVGTREGQQVIEQGGDYALALKGNQGSLRDDVQLFLDDPSTPLAQDVQISKGHGRIETRIASVSSDVDWLQETHQWPGLSTVGKVTAIRRQNGAESEQSRYYLLSETCSAERFNYIVRGHWGIENRLHWVLDVTCHEDQARNRKGHCAENLSLLRKLALNLARLEASKGSMRGKLKRAGWDDGYLISILSQFTKIHMR